MTQEKRGSGAAGMNKWSTHAVQMGQTLAPQPLATGTPMRPRIGKPRTYALVLAPSPSLGVHT